MIVTINPANGEKLAEYAVMQPSEIGEVLRLTESDFLKWRHVSAFDRRALMKNAAALLQDREKEFARLISLEMGKPFGQSAGEIGKCAWVCDYFADHAEEYLLPEACSLDGARALVTFEPLGVVLGVMPWNFPFWQVIRFAVPAMMAGNGIVVKHAPNVTGCSIAIEQLFRDAGFPGNLYRAVHVDIGDVDRLTGLMIEHPAVRAVSITGSTGAGRAVAARAGRALKRSVLELGGCDPYIVLDDADIRQAVDVCVAGRLLNSGQSCISAKRFIVQSPVREVFIRMIVERMRATVMGDPFREGVEVGPIARADLRELVHSQVMRSVAAGAKLLCGGVIPEGPGTYYPPTVLEEVRKGMPAYEEEIFGPVASIIVVGDDDEAVRIANDSDYGLGSAVFSSSEERALAIARRLETGNCFINAMVKSDPRLPFGGVKQSGYGRELSRYGIREFVNVKSLYLG
jgi:succinate-semialdehyde dehydrogenase/glutarate-semialdehyde dehydrogenase